jgi:hypothetical protein
MSKVSIIGKETGHIPQSLQSGRLRSHDHKHVTIRRDRNGECLHRGGTNESGTHMEYERFKGVWVDRKKGRVRVEYI